MKTSAIFLCALSLLLNNNYSYAASQNLISSKTLKIFKPEHVSTVALSPRGNQLALLKQEINHQAIYIRNISNRKEIKVFDDRILNVENSNISYFFMG